MEELDVEDEDIYASGKFCYPLWFTYLSSVVVPSLSLFVYLLFFNFNLGFDYEQTEVDVEPSKAISGSGDKMLQLEHKKRGSLLGFKPASNSDYKLER